MNESFDLTIHGQLFQIHPSQIEPARAVILALHGLSGDQHSMEIFTRKFHRNYCVIYPCAFHKSSNGGYSWIETQNEPSSDASVWVKAAKLLHFNLELLMIDLDLRDLPHHLIGFSQGAALGLVYSVQFLSPEAKTALLAGFAPEGFSLPPQSLQHRTFFIYHGQNDTTVHPDEAARLVHALTETGAGVEYCQSTAGHKLSLACLESMEKYILSDQPAGV